MVDYAKNTCDQLIAEGDEDDVVSCEGKIEWLNSEIKTASISEKSLESDVIIENLCFIALINKYRDSFPVELNQIEVATDDLLSPDVFLKTIEENTLRAELRASEAERQLKLVTEIKCVTEQRLSVAENCMLALTEKVENAENRLREAEQHTLHMNQRLKDTEQRLMAEMWRADNAEERLLAIEQKSFATGLQVSVENDDNTSIATSTTTSDKMKSKSSTSERGKFKSTHRSGKNRPTSRSYCQRDKSGLPVASSITGEKSWFHQFLASQIKW